MHGAAKQHAQLELTAKKVLTELLGVGYAATKATDIRVSDKLRALELLAKHRRCCVIDIVRLAARG